MNTPLVLLGYMGCGKSTIGRLLAERLLWQFWDLDAYIVAGEERSISDIFRERGEIYFRKIESEYLGELLFQPNLILSLGGGTPCYGSNMERIKEVTTSVYLEATPEVLFERLRKGRSKRPVIAHLSEENLLDFVQKHLFERTPCYDKATHTLPVDSKTPEQIVQELLGFVSNV